MLQNAGKSTKSSVKFSSGQWMIFFSGHVFYVYTVYIVNCPCKQGLLVLVLCNVTEDDLI